MTRSSNAASASGGRAPSRAALIASCHVSRRSTQTGRLTAVIFDEVLDRAARSALLC